MGVMESPPAVLTPNAVERTILYSPFIKTMTNARHCRKRRHIGPARKKWRRPYSIGRWSACYETTFGQRCW